MSRLAVILAFASFFLTSIAEAQPMGRGKPDGRGPMMGQGEMRGPMGQGGGGVSPVMMTCREDLASVCGGRMGMPGVQCLMDNITDISEPCADALSAAMENMEQGHGQDGGDEDED